MPISITDPSVHLARNRGLLFGVAGLGGLLYGVDVGVVAAAFPFLAATSGYGAARLSLAAAAVLLGSVLSTAVSGPLADRMGRRGVLLLGGMLFLAGVPVSALSGGFPSLMAGRLLQGLGAGICGVVVPLYLAESMCPAVRGRGTAVFQLTLTSGFLVAAVAAWGLGRGIDRAALALGAQAAHHLQEQAWRGIFWLCALPGLLFVGAAGGVGESPRWLLRRGRREEALGALLRTREVPGAQAELACMEEALPREGDAREPLGPCLRPFLVASTILVCNQGVGVNAIISFHGFILARAGLEPSQARMAYLALASVNVLLTLVAMALVDRAGRRALLLAGTVGVLASLMGLGFLLRHGGPGAGTGLLAAALTLGYMASFAVGPGVCAWLALSELLPARIRAAGMGAGMLLNQGVSAAVVAGFLPAWERWGPGGPSACTRRSRRST